MMENVYFSDVGSVWLLVMCLVAWILVEKMKHGNELSIFHCFVGMENCSPFFL